MKTIQTIMALLVVTGLLATHTALADCVDYSKARAQKAAAEMKRNPLAPSKLGLPAELTDLTIDAERSTGDPQCDKPEKRQYFFYNTRMSLLDFYSAVFPYIQPNDYWPSPVGGSSHKIWLTSGAIVEIQCKSENRKCTGLPIDQPDQIRELSVQWPIWQTPRPLTGEGPGWNWTPRDFAEGRNVPAAGKADSFAGSKAKANPSTNAANKPGGSGAEAENAPQVSTNDCGSNQSTSGKGGAAVAKLAKSVLGGLLAGKRVPTEVVPAPSPSCNP